MSDSDVLNEPVITPCFLELLSRALMRMGRPFTVTEQNPMLRKALQVRPTATTVALLAITCRASVIHMA
jgi:hypothetical protein